MKLGLLGGSFDPIHLGHLRAAEVAREELRLDRVLFVPAGTPPHRPALASPARDRYAMVAIALAGEASFAVSDVELERSGVSYTVDTLEALSEQHPGDRLVLILGSDAFAEFGDWHRVDRVRRMASVAVIRRPGTEQPGPAGVALLSEPGLPISASAIRQRIAGGGSPRFLVPPGVADYIAKRGLYQ